MGGGHVCLECSRGFVKHACVLQAFQRNGFVNDISLHFNNHANQEESKQVGGVMLWERTGFVNNYMSLSSFWSGPTVWMS